MDIGAEIPETEHEKPKPLLLDELQARIRALDDVIDGLREKNASYEEIKEKQQQLLREFIERQVTEKERFRNIFRTEQGSIYFTLDTGESLRIKLRDDNFKMQPICRKIFYVDSQQATKLLAMQNKFNFQKNIIGEIIHTTSCEVGATPIEFGIEGMPEIGYKAEPEQLVIEGDFMGAFASGYHQGHPISEVIK